MRPPESLEAFRYYVRDFVAREVLPHAERWIADRTVTRGLHEAAGDAGLLGLKYPRALGGQELPYGFTYVLLEEYGRSGAMSCLLSVALQSEFATPHLALYGSELLQQRYLVPAIAGTCIVAIAMTEPEGGSDLAGLRTVATPVAGGYRVTGRKWMIGNASLADVFCVVCRAGDAVPGKLPRLTTLLVAASTAGCSVVRPVEKIGLHATPNCEIAFDDCFVPDDHVLGRHGLALPQGLVANAYERIALAVIAVGAMREGWETAARFLSIRGASERPLIDRSPWRHRLMEDYIRMTGAEHIVKDAARSVETGKPDQALVLMAKVAATETCCAVLAHAAQAHGARGFLADEKVGRLVADARALTVGGGASEALLEALSRMVLPTVLKR